MTLLEEIQTAAVDPNSDLSTLLRKCKLLAARLGSRPLEEWVIWESNGYPDPIEVPSYRIWPLEVKGHFFGAFGSGLENAPIPTACLPDSARKHYTHYECRQSIASIEAILSSGKGQTIRVNTGDLALSLGRNVYENQNCVQAWAQFGTGQLVELTNAVRNRILDFTLALWKQAPDAGDLGQHSTPPLETKFVTQIFNTTVYGGSANLVGTANASSVEFNIGMKDFVALADALSKSGVLEADISDLQVALREEPEAPTSKNFGPKVSGWIAKMIGSAASGAWGISLGAAGNLLATLIGKYYGIGV